MQWSVEWLGVPKRSNAKALMWDYLESLNTGAVRNDIETWDDKQWVPHSMAGTLSVPGGTSGSGSPMAAGTTSTRTRSAMTKTESGAYREWCKLFDAF